MTDWLFQQTIFRIPSDLYTLPFLILTKSRWILIAVLNTSYQDTWRQIPNERKWWKFKAFSCFYTDSFYIITYRSTINGETFWNLIFSLYCYVLNVKINNKFEANCNSSLVFIHLSIESSKHSNINLPKERMLLISLLSINNILLWLMDSVHWTWIHYF